MTGAGLFDLPPRPPDHSNPDDYLTELEHRILNLSPRAEFVAGQIEAAMRDAGWKPLPEPRVIGPLLLRLAHRGWIRKSGVTTTTARSHGGAATTWRRTTKHGEAAA